MLALDDNAIALGDGSVAFGYTTKAVVTYRLERYATGSSAGLRVGVGPDVDFTVSPFTSNGTVAIGDQTTAPGLDSSVRITSIDLTCP